MRKYRFIIVPFVSVVMSTSLESEGFLCASYCPNRALFLPALIDSSPFHLTDLESKSTGA